MKFRPWGDWCWPTFTIRKTLCRVYSNTMSAPKFWNGTERSPLTIPYIFLRLRTLYLKIRRVLSLRALLLCENISDFWKGGEKKKKRKEREKKKIAMKRWSIFNTKLVSTLWPLPLFLPGPPAWERSFFFPFVAERRANYPRKYVGSAGSALLADRNNPPI